MNIVTLKESNFRNIAETLRIIANEVESGLHGDVATCALVLTGSQVDVFHMGAGDVADAVFAMHLGIHKIARMTCS
jgi:hypothetical protein